MPFTFLVYTFLLAVVLLFYFKQPSLSLFRPYSKIGNELDKLIAQDILGQFPDAKKGIPRYKFFSNLMEILWEQERVLGLNLKKSYGQLRIFLQSDLAKQREVESLKTQALVQLAFIGLYSWGLTGYLNWQLGGTVATNIYLALGWQFLGILGYLRTVKILDKKFQSYYPELFQALISLSVLLKSGLSLGHMLQRSGMDHLSKKKTSYSHAIEIILQSMREKGMIPIDELELTLFQVKTDYAMGFEKFKRQVEGLKFFVLIAFALPSYFLAIIGQLSAHFGQLFV